MGLDFSKTTTAAAPAATVVPDTKDEIAVVEPVSYTHLTQPTTERV